MMMVFYYDRKHRHTSGMHIFQRVSFRATTSQPNMNACLNRYWCCCCTLGVGITRNGDTSSCNIGHDVETITILLCDSKQRKSAASWVLYSIILMSGYYIYLSTQFFSWLSSCHSLVAPFRPMRTTMRWLEKFESSNILQSIHFLLSSHRRSWSTVIN